MENGNGVEMASTVAVTTFDATIFAQIPVKEETVLAEDFILTVGKSLGLKTSSIQFFGLFQGLLHPTIKFKSIDAVPMNVKGLTFQKWCFDTRKESQILSDPIATQLICAQSKAYIREENKDPSTAAKFVKLCQSIPDYNSIHLPDCRLDKEFWLLPHIPADSIVTLTLLQRGMVLRVDCSDREEEYFISWRKIQRWRKTERDECLVMYDVYSVPSDDFGGLCIQTLQAKYLLAATMEMIKGLQSELGGPIFQTSDLTRNQRREVIEWNNIVYSKTRFNVEREIAEKYVEISMLR
ncbi:uncharacterized protein LOC110975780 isoform X2 [Acanthaster planci]|uniref:Uncharacterized protein LOC110975780 isoform X2 n=1 Tax=Acanthaster planci TaxID=133434 RepID=A0A8B7XW37_ACAPL|nr:uncharacterized protein LOC110975780 isoform X2 [Acanthaster planci]